MPRHISELSVAEIKAMIANYDRQRVTSGGNYTRAELALELDRRRPTKYPPVEFAETILRLCHVSDDQRVSYGELWLAYNEGPLPKGQAWVKPLTDGLAVLGAYCVQHGLPIISTLVVNGGDRQLSSKAAENVWTYMKDKFPNISSDPEQFVREQAELAARLRPDELPGEVVQA